MKNILIIKLGAFGDFISAMGAIQDIREHDSQAKIHLLTTPPYASIADKCPWIDNVVVAKRQPLWRLDEHLKLKTQINELNIDKVIDLQCSSRTNLYYQFLFKKTSWCGTANHCDFQLEKKPYYHNEQTQLERLLGLCNIKTSNTLKPDLSWMSGNIDGLLQKQNLLEKPFAVFFHGCSANNHDKRWPYYNELAKELDARNIIAISIPGPDEIDEAKKLPFKSLLNNQNKSLNFFDTAEVCKKAAFVIGNDTGPTHLAAFVGAKGLTLYGDHETNMHHFTKNTNFSSIRKDSLADITVETVLDYIENHFL